MACDNKRPECSRCRNKGIECGYPVNTPRAKLQGQGRHTGWAKTANSPVAEYPSSTRERLERNGTGNVVVNGTRALSDQDLVDLGGGFLDWDDGGIGLADIFDTPIFNSSLSPDSSTLTFEATASAARTYQTQESFDFSSSPIPRTPTIVVPSLIRRPKTQPRTQRTANLILHNLKSYLLMIQRHNDLPPFIHKSFISSSVEDADMEPLTNCLSLVHMLNGGGQAGRKLFWKNVQMECERLSAEVWSFRYGGASAGWC